MATFDDGSQVLVTEWDTGSIEAAKRLSPIAIWGPPTLDVRVEEDEVPPAERVNHPAVRHTLGEAS